MTDVINNLFVAVQQSISKLNVFHDINWFKIAFSISVYSLQQMLLSMHPQGSTNSLSNALYDHRSSKFDIAIPVP